MLEGLVERINRLRDEKLSPSWSVRLEIEVGVGLRDASGRSLRPRLLDPDYFEVTPAEVARFTRRRREFDEKVADGFKDLSSEEKARYTAAVTGYRGALVELKPLAQEAIQTALTAYGISPKPGTILNGPPPPTGPDDIPSFIGRQAPWSPSFNESLEEGRFGLTTDDGRVTIGLDAFRYAGLLAATLYHESLHFSELFDPAADVKNAPAAEARVRRSIRPLLEKVFSLDPADIQSHDEKMAREEVIAGRWKATMENGLSPWKKSQRPAFPGDVQPRHRFWSSDMGDLERILDRVTVESGDRRDPLAPLIEELAPAARAVAKSLAESDALRAGQEAPDKAREAAEAAFRATQDPQWDALRSWVATACRYLKPVDLVPTGTGGSNPDFDHMKWAIAENDDRARAKRSSDEAARQYLVSHSVVLAKAQIEAGLRKRRRELDPCERDVIELLVKAPGPIQSEWLVGQLDYRKGGGALGVIVRGIAKAVRKGSSVIVSGIKAPFIAVGLASSSSAPPSPTGGAPTRGSGPDREPREREPREIWRGSPTLEHLRGIASGSLQFP